jgi:DNA-binding NarL/FixJ family response regulator
MSKIRVILVDDHAVLRAGLRMLIDSQPDMQIVGEAASTKEALPLIRQLRPDVISLDLSMPGGGGMSLLEQLKETNLPTRVLILTMHDDPAYFRSAVAAGAAGYVVKTAADSELLTAIRAVHGGRLFISMPNGGSEALLRAAQEAPNNTLSDREQQVLQMLAEGYTNKEIGAKLDLSVKTIETYRARVASKLQLRTRADIVRYALENGMLKHEPDDIK